MAVRFQLRRDTAANWTSANSVLALGEPGVETDTLKVKVGDGSTAWNSLGYSITKDFADLTNTPTTLAAYGITDALSLVQLSVTQNNASGNGALTYNNATGVFEYTPPNFEGLNGNFTGSVFADDSTIMVDGVSATINLANNTTTDLAEGTNLYYTDVRADARIAAAGITDLSDADQTVQTTDNVTFSSVTGNVITSQIDSADSSAIEIQTDVTMLAGLTVGNHIIPSSNENIDLGSNTNRFRELFLSGNTISLDNLKLSCVVATGTLQIHDGSGTLKNIQSHNINANDITANNITTTGYIAGPAVFTIDPAAVGDNTGKVVIAGDLQVDGTQTTINSTTVAIDDLKLSVATDAADSAAANGAGITVGGANANITYTHATTSWDFDKPVNVTGNIGVTGTVDGVDIAARDAILTSTTTTAGAALPKAGGSMTGELIIADTGTLDIRMGTDKRVTWSGALGEIGSVAGFQATNTAGSALSSFGMRGTDLRFATGSEERVRITDTGVGIGTDNPGYLLTVKKDVDAFAVKIENDGNSPGTAGNAYADASDGLWVDTRWNTATNTPFKVTSNSGTSDMMIIKGDGKVGIGTSSPARLLNIVNDPGSNPIQSIRNSNTSWGQYALTRYGTEGEDFRYMDFGYYRGTTEDTRGLVIKSQANATLSTFLDSGNVGIGTAGPEVKLEVNGGADGSVVFAGRSDGGNGNNRRFNLIAFADGGGSNYGGGLKIQTRDDVNVFHDRVTVKSNGSVGIGTTSPTSKLTVDSNISSSSATVIDILQSTNGVDKQVAGIGVLIDNGGESTNAGGMFFQTASGGSLTERLRLTSSGGLELGYNGAARQQSDSQAMTITTPASGGGQGIALKRLDSNSDQQLGEISFSNNTQDGLGGMRMKTSGAVNTTQLDFDIASGGAISTPLKLDSGGVTVTGNHTQNGARVQMQSFDVFASSTSSRRVRVTLDNYESCYVRLMAQRTNGGDSIAYWEGVINNNNNQNYVTEFHSKSSNPTFTFDYTTASIFQWTFNATLSSGDGVIYVQDIRGGASISLIAT